MLVVVPKKLSLQYLSKIISDVKLYYLYTLISIILYLLYSV
ncbi:hypothetical protein YN1HA_4610 [Sulfurisphaera ohwakuensis]